MNFFVINSFFVVVGFGSSISSDMLVAFLGTNQELVVLIMSLVYYGIV